MYTVANVETVCLTACLEVPQSHRTVKRARDHETRRCVLRQTCDCLGMILENVDDRIGVKRDHNDSATAGAANEILGAFLDNEGCQGAVFSWKQVVPAFEMSPVDRIEDVDTVSSLCIQPCALRTKLKAFHPFCTTQ
ncbi:hypothetical protein F441_21860 [Phytophthora nicotianae CJ01A1]|uniref:Uncharacterized protein n=3 Tax=Phytophthora nicotianae TaxID=4792 RepID=W2Y428_PHYNI|nr:hypothetical protein F444_21989 [Phytophthora nicotianae P1976]ETP00784.1 hypothetical protein F441_21860 [Phytophthora nicotianae CJ01A1]ETP28934.1 hypothetical protein F442_21832 [Phytophthora nicotianae P10297]